MKRFICLFLCILCLAGCATQPPAEPTGTTESQIPEPPIVPNVTDPVPPIAPTTPTRSATPEGDVIETDFYTITLPIDWTQAAGYTLTENRLTMFEKQSNLEGLGGRLFTLQVLPVREDYTYYPSYELLGKFLADGVEYNLVATFPTDVQFSFDQANLYNTLYDQIPQVFASLQPANGYTFTPAE